MANYMLYAVFLNGGFEVPVVKTFLMELSVTSCCRDISDNHIGGDIPLSLPSTLRNLCVNLNPAFISGLANQF